MSRKQLGAAPDAESAPGEHVGWFARLRAQPGFRTAAVAFVLTVALGVGGPAAYAVWSQSTSGKITGTINTGGSARIQSVPEPEPSTPAPSPSSARSTSSPASDPAISAPAVAPSASASVPGAAPGAASAPAISAPSPAASVPAAAPSTPAPAPAASTPAASTPARAALPLLTGKAACGLDSAGNTAVSRPTPAAALPAGAAVVMTIVDPKGTTVYVVNQTAPVALKNVPGLEARLKGAAGTAGMTISFTTGYVAAPLPTAPVELLDAARVLEWSKAPAVSTTAAYDAARSTFIC